MGGGNIMTTYDEFIQNIINTRGQGGIPSNEYKERHHIIPVCLGGNGDKRRKHPNIIGLYPREHFIAHRLLAIENPTNYSLVYAYHMMSTMSKNNDRHIEITPEEYEEAKLLGIPLQREIASNNSSGRHWYTNGDISIMDYECPKGYGPGRSDKDKIAIGKTSIGRTVNKGKHWYTNGSEQAMLYSCPEGGWPGTLPMSDEARLAHGKALKGRTKDTNKGLETLSAMCNRVDLNEFTYDFINKKLTDLELSEKYKCTVKMIERYRRKNKLFNRLREG